ncbi:hypothetical protein [Comamonas serinivorans]|uniref:hypothetical protein n=1 Tax=Comamonas serinivorans TaxID=1082851 RepID=UPI0012FAE554|nr:hypothetical protein [Comamonas serinivorans]
MFDAARILGATIRHVAQPLAPCSLGATAAPGKKRHLWHHGGSALERRRRSMSFAGSPGAGRTPCGSPTTAACRWVCS